MLAMKTEEEGYEPRNVGDLWELEKTNGFFAGLQNGGQPY